MHERGPQEHKWRLSAIRVLCDSLVVGQVMPRIYRIADIKAGPVFRKQTTSGSIPVHTGSIAFPQGFEPDSRPGLPRARSHCQTWCGQPIPWDSLLQGLRILPGPLGQATRPVVHQDTAAFEQVRAGIGRLDPVADHMGQGRFDRLPGMVRLLGPSVPETGQAQSRGPRASHR